jgi:hypothetical protein
VLGIDCRFLLVDGFLLVENDCGSRAGIFASLISRSLVSELFFVGLRFTFPDFCALSLFIYRPLSTWFSFYLLKFHVSSHIQISSCRNMSKA